MIYMLKMDSYDLKHTGWFPFFVLVLFFWPFLWVLYNKIIVYKNANIIDYLYSLISLGDYSFIDFVKQNLYFDLFTVIIFIFVLIIYCIYTLVYIDSKYLTSIKYIVYGIIILILFVFLPLFLSYFVLSSIYNNNYKNQVDNSNIIEYIEQNGIFSIYDLLVKYNYPCFIK